MKKDYFTNSIKSTMINFFTKRILLLLASIAGVLGSLDAQVTLTATGGLPAGGPFATLGAAFTAINSGTHQGSINISINGNTNEGTVSAILNGSGIGSANYTDILIHPTVANLTVTGSSTTATIKLNGADEVNINGLFAGGNLTIANTNPSLSDFSSVVWVSCASASDGAKNNKVQNCKIKGGGTTTTFAAIVQSGTVVGGVAEIENAGNSYLNNIVTAAESGIEVVGPSGNEGGTIITGNTIGGTLANDKMSWRSIFLAQQLGVTVSGNTITGSFSTVAGVGFENTGISINGTMSGGSIDGNFISDIKKQGFWGCSGIFLSSSSATTGLTISNNFIWDIAAGGFAGTNIDDNGYGIALAAGGGFNIYFNTINLNTAPTNNIGNPAAMWTSTSTSVTAINLKDNIFSNQQSGTSNRFAIYVQRPNTIFTTINYNDYYSVGTLGFLGANQATIAAWRTATGQDLNSVAVDPSFFSPTNLHLFFNSTINDIGSPAGGITTDIDGDIRNGSTPDIGADEFTPPNCSGNFGGTVSASITSLCAMGSATLSSTGFNYGLGVSYHWEQSPNGSTGWVDVFPAQTNPVSATTGTISATTWYRLRVNCTFTGGAPGYSGNTVQIVVNNPQVTSVTPGTRCGIGTVNLAATGTSLQWYDVPTGGIPLGAGPNFTTPSISASTPFYVAATIGGSTFIGGKPSTNGADGTNPTGGIQFTVTQAFTLNSVKMYPTGAGTATINLFPGTSTGGTAIFTQNVTFPAAAPAGQTVSFSGWTITPGTYTIFLSNTTAQCWRDFPGGTATPAIAYPYNIGGACTLTDGSLSGFYYFFYNWNINTGCEGTRSTVMANVTPPPAINPTASPSTICVGSNVNLNVTSPTNPTGYGYVWNPGNLTGAAQVVTPASTTIYTVLATDASGGPNNGCVNQANITVTVNPTPTALTVSPSVANVCAAPVITTITASGGLLVNKTVFTDMFEGNPTPSAFFTTTGVITATSNSTYFYQGTRSVHLINSPTTNTGAYEQITGLDLSQYASPQLTFYHICASEKNFDYGYVEYDNGSGWSTIPPANYAGTGVLKNGVISFDASSYPDWNAQFNLGSTPGAGPATSLWKKETINLTGLTSANFKIRFRYTSDISLTYYGWLIDSLRISGTGQAPITWTPNGAGSDLYSNPGATILYVAGTPATTVYTKPTVSHIYTASANGGSCSATATSNLTVTSVTVNVNITANPGLTVCAGSPVTFTAVTTNGGTTPFYQWYINYVNSSSVPVYSGTGAAFSTYTTSTLVNGDIVKVRLLSNVGSCAANNPDSSQVSMIVNPKPTGGITSGGITTICTGSAVTLTSNATVTPGSISSYQWLLNGVLQATIPAPTNTYSATTAGTYNVVSTAVTGCFDTSANYIITHPTFNITATPGANGDIGPVSGVVPVPCGDNYTFTITPNAGYNICTITVDGSPVTVVTPAGQSYTFNNVLATHSISATFCIPGCATPPTATAGTDASFCSNASYTLSGASVGGSATSGTWSGGAGTFSPNANTVNATYTPSAGEITAGTVTLTLTTNNPNGAPCIASTASVTLTIKEAPVVSITGAAGYCPASSTTLTAVASINPVGPITYQWVRLPATTLGSVVTQTASTAGTYQVTASANGCSAAASLAVIAFISPSVSITGPTEICTGTAATLSASVVAGSGSIPAAGFQWSGANCPTTCNAIPGETASTFSVSAGGSFVVKVTDANGCVSATSSVFSIGPASSPLIGNYTIGAGPASCTNYTSFATAINDLNVRKIKGNVRFDVGAGYTETVPVLGLQLGSAGLNDSTFIKSYSITFRKVSVGANPVLNAYTGGSGSPNTPVPDGILGINGTDNVTIDGIDFVDGNASGASMMEYGIGLFKSNFSPSFIIDGAQNIFITNCTITLNKLNNGINAGPSLEGSVGIYVLNALSTNATTAVTPTSARGSNSNNKFYANTIQNCNQGIGFSGYYVGSGGLTALNDVGNDVGGVFGTTGNTIVNFGGGGTNLACGIRTFNQWNTNIAFNTLNNNNGAGINHPGIIRGIYTQVAAGGSSTVNNNNLTIKGGGTTQSVVGIENLIGSGGGGNTVNISDNTITGSYTTATSGPWTGILSNATATTLIMGGNTVQNCTLPGTGNWIGISNAAVCTNVTMNNNILKNNVIASTGVFTGILTTSTTASTGVLNQTGNLITGNSKTYIATPTPAPPGVSLLGSGNNGTAFITGNTINNNTVIGGAFNLQLNCISSGSATTAYTLDSNTVSNNSITGMSTTGLGILYGFYDISVNVNETLTRNKIRNLFITGNSSSVHVIRGLHTATSAASVKTVSDNLIDSLYTNSGSAAQITGISFGNGTTSKIFKNKIQNLFPGQNGASASFAKGISVVGASVDVYNNMINLDLSLAFSPAANAVMNGTDVLKGIDVAGGTTINVYYNTIRLGGTGNGVFGSSALGISSTVPTVTLINNILDNESIFKGAGIVAALRRAQTTLATYGTSSNNNVFYAGAPSANNVLYYNGTTGYQVMTPAGFQAAVTPRETASLTTVFSSVPASSPFINIINPIDMHIKLTAGCAFDGAATPISITTDIDDSTRNATNPDIGADEFNGTGGTTTWKGINTDWLDVVNWCGVLPTSASDVTIPTSVANYPLITTIGPVTHNINIAPGASVTITGAGSMGIYGSITNAGIFNVVDGTIEMAGPLAQTIPATAFQAGNIKNLIINNATVTLGGALNLWGKLSFTGSNRTFATAGNLTIKSNAAGTGSVGDITNGGTNSGNQVTGDVTVERFMSMRRAWRFISAPTQHNLQNIHQAWQENQGARVLLPVGFGIQIPSDRSTWAVEGFDFQTPGGGASVKTYDPTTNTWIGITATIGAAGNFVAGRGYMTFVRGDRTIDFFQPVATTTTVLRDKGALVTGSFGPVAVGAGQFAAVGNPYASAINFANFTKVNLSTFYYLWDPQLGSLGAYQTVSTGSITPGGGSYTASNKFIESGQAFFVHSSGPAGSLTLTEPSKVDGSYLVTRQTNNYKQLRTNLNVVANGMSQLYDGVLNQYDGSFSDVFDGEDAEKLGNFGENLGILSNGKILSVESRADILRADTIFYKLGQVKLQNYEFEFIPGNLGQAGVEAFLEDQFLNTRTSVSLDDTTRVAFSIINDPASYASDRFRMVFRLLAPVPLSFTNITAAKQNKDIMVSWKISSELNINHYEIEKSVDGINFAKLGTQVATGNGSANVNYNWLDEHALTGYNYYRVRSISNVGEAKLSEVVKINIAGSATLITIYPNPVKTDHIIHIAMDNLPEGLYDINIINNTGQTLIHKKLNHAGGNSVYDITVGNNLAHGNYILSIAGVNNIKSTFKFLY